MACSLFADSSAGAEAAGCDGGFCRAKNLEQGHCFAASQLPLSISRAEEGEIPSAMPTRMAISHAEYLRALRPEIEIRGARFLSRLGPDFSL